MARNKRTTKDIDDLDQKYDKAVARFLNLQQNGLDVVLEKDARDDPVVDLVALLGHGVLIREERAVVARARGPNTVNGRHDRHEVLELVEVCGGDVDCSVEGIFEGWVEATEGQLIDDMREVEVYARMLVIFTATEKSTGQTDCCDRGVLQTPCIRGLEQ